jgi:lysophospholipase L1-like esterase
MLGGHPPERDASGISLIFPDAMETPDDVAAAASYRRARDPHSTRGGGSSMKRLIALTVAVLAASLALATPARADDSSATRYYVALGDSLAVGVQPSGPPPFNETDDGYADQLYVTLAVTDPKLKLIKLGCGGESTTSMRFGSQPPTVAASCGPPDFYQHRYPNKTQLAEAVGFLESHKGKVALVTIDIGGNDVLGPGGADEVAKNLPVILEALRDATDGPVPIVGLNYYSPFLPAAWAEGGLEALRGAVDALRTFNDALTGIYTSARVSVADVAEAFHSNDFTLVDRTPLNVALACEWTWFCSVGDVHPTTEGYGAIAQAVGIVLTLPYVDDFVASAFIGLPQYACPQGYVPLILFQKPLSDPLWQYDHNHSGVICRRFP